MSAHTRHSRANSDRAAMRCRSECERKSFEPDAHCVCTRRHCCCARRLQPNPGFLAQLRELDEALRQQRDEIARAQSHMTDPTSPTTDTDSATTATGNGNATTAD